MSPTSVILHHQPPRAILPIIIPNASLNLFVISGMLPYHRSKITRLSQSILGGASTSSYIIRYVLARRKRRYIGYGIFSANAAIWSIRYSPVSPSFLDHKTRDQMVDEMIVMHYEYIYIRNFNFLERAYAVHNLFSDFPVGNHQRFLKNYG